MIDSAEEFIRLRDSHEKSEYDRSALEEASSDVWHEVLDKYPEYGKWVAYNKTVPLEILDRLCGFDVGARRSVALKRKLSVEIFERLCMDEDEIVRCNLAVNKKVPVHVLNILKLDEDKDVRDAAEHNLAQRSKE